MANHISHASLPYPIKNARYTVLVPFLDSTGAPTDPTTPDTEVSQDGGAFADAAEEITTISGSNGMGYVTLTGAETNNSAVGLAFKVASGPKPTLMTLYPKNLAVIETGTLAAGSAGGGTFAAFGQDFDPVGCFIRTTGGTGGGGTGGANNQARRIVTFSRGSFAFTVSPNWETTPSTDTTYDILLPDGMTREAARALMSGVSTISSLSINSSGQALVDAVKVGGTTQTGRDIGASVLLSSGTGTGQLDFTSGVVKANLAQILGTAFTEGAGGRIAAAFKQFFNIASPAATMDHGVLVDTATNLTNAATSGDLTATMKTSIATAVWNALTSGITTVGSIGKLIKDNLDAAVSSRSIAGDVMKVSTGTGANQLDVTSGVIRANLAQILGTALTETTGLLAAGFKQFFNIASPTSTMNTITNLTNAATAGDLTATMKTSVTTAATAATPTVTAGTVSDKTGYALTSGERTSIAAAIWNALTSGITTSSSIGKLIVDNLNATISSRLASASYTAPDNAAIESAIAGVGVSVGNIFEGVIDSATSNTITDASLSALFADDTLTGNLVALPGAIATGRGQTRLITGYVSSTGVITVHPDFVVTPQTGFTYIIKPGGESVSNEDVTTIKAQTDQLTFDPVYQARVDVVDDNANTTDRYVVCLFKNGIAYHDGSVTGPTIQVWDKDGVDLIAEDVMVEAGSTNTYFYDATGAARMVDGAAYVAKVVADIGGVAMEWFQVIGRDSSS